MVMEAQPNGMKKQAMTTNQSQAALRDNPSNGQGRVESERALAYLYAFRRVVVGLALVGAAVGWVEQVPWLAAAGVCIAIGELLESSYYIGVLRWRQSRARHAP